MLDPGHPITAFFDDDPERVLDSLPAIDGSSGKVSSLDTLYRPPGVVGLRGHRNGLFAESIFGPDSDRFGHIETVGVVHPSVFPRLVEALQIDTPAPSCAEGAFRAADFLLAAGLPSVDSTGVTHVFADFFGTTPASDFSEVCSAACGSSPSRGCLSSTTDDEAPPRSPGSRTGGKCERAELSDPGWRDRSKLTFVGSSPWPSAKHKGVGASPEKLCFGALSPGPLIRSPTLRRAKSPARRKD